MVGIEGVEFINWHPYEDERGWFVETFKKSDCGTIWPLVQHNESQSKRGVIRGLHYQWDMPMGKLMRVIRGAAYMVALDLRSQSPTFGLFVGMVLTDKDTCALWAPAGFGRGFQALTDDTRVWYACTAEYNRHGEGAVRWDSVDIPWPLEPTIISPKDRTVQTFEQYRLQPRF